MEFIPCNKTTTALDTAKLYLFHVWKDHGLPHTIVSDCGLQFALQVMTDLCKWLGIAPKLSTAHHPQTDGQTEVMNQEVQQYLRLFCAEEQEQWSDWLGLAQFAINNHQHSAMKFSPFQLTCTYSPHMGVEQHAAKLQLPRNSRIVSPAPMTTWSKCILISLPRQISLVQTLRHMLLEIRSGSPPIISISLMLLGSCRNDGLATIPS